MNISGLFEFAVLTIPVIGLVVIIALVIIAARLKAMHQTLVETQDAHERKP
jgi:hypothetical protein